MSEKSAGSVKMKQLKKKNVAQKTWSSIAIDYSYDFVYEMKV